MSHLLVEPGKVTLVTLNRPEAHNCIDADTARLLAEAIKSFAADDSSKVLVVTGAGDKSFCSGADLKRAGSMRDNPYFEEASPLGFSRLDAGKPTIAAVNGYCFAGGMELAAWCDFRIASDNAEFGVLNRRWGIPLIDGGTQRLREIVGLGNALYLISTGMRIDANKAQQMGFVQEVVPQGSALDRAAQLAEHICTYPSAALIADRASTHAGMGVPIAESLRAEQQRGFGVVGDPDSIERLRGYAEGDRPEPPRPPLA